jgi:hypothetical protein
MHAIAIRAKGKERIFSKLFLFFLLPILERKGETA